MRRLHTGAVLLALLATHGAGLADAKPGVGTPPAEGPAARDAQAAYKAGHYDEVIRLLNEVSRDQTPPKSLLRLAIDSHLQLGQPEGAFTTYGRLSRLTKEEDPDLLRRIAWTFLTLSVRDPQEPIRSTAYVALADVASDDTVPLLQDGLLDQSLFVRIHAAEGLGRVAEQNPRGRGAVQSSLLRTLDDPAPAVRIAAINALGYTGGAGVDARLVAIARTEDGPVGIFAAGALVRLGKTSALRDVVEAATLPDPDTRMAALGVLGSLRQPSTLSTLSQSVYDPVPSVRAFAAGALGEFGSPEGAGPLMHALEDEHPRVRSVAAASLGRLRLSHTRPMLWQAVRDPIVWVRIGAVEGLLRLGEQEAVLIATELAQDAALEVRAATAQALGQAAAPAGLRVLARLLDDPQPRARAVAARSIGKYRGNEAVSVLKKALADVEVIVRVTAAGSLLQALSPRRS